MAMSDPIADMLTRIRNAVKAKHVKVDIPGSCLKIEIAKILKKEGYVKDYGLSDVNSQKCLTIYLKGNILGHKYGGIVKIKRVSKPGRRVYCKAKDVNMVYNGMGIGILSTSQGVMTDKDARKNRVGGEVLCTVW